MISINNMIILSNPPDNVALSITIQNCIHTFNSKIRGCSLHIQAQIARGNKKEEEEEEYEK